MKSDETQGWVFASDQGETEKCRSMLRWVGIFGKLRRAVAGLSALETRCCPTRSRTVGDDGVQGHNLSWYWALLRLVAHRVVDRGMGRIPLQEAVAVGRDHLPRRSPALHPAIARERRVAIGNHHYVKGHQVMLSGSVMNKYVHAASCRDSMPNASRS